MLYLSAVSLFLIHFLESFLDVQEILCYAKTALRINQKKVLTKVLRTKQNISLREEQLSVLNWTSVDSEGSLFSRGKTEHYTILVRGIPEERPQDCIIELYVTNNEMTISEIKYNPHNEQIKILARFVIWGNLPPANGIEKTIEVMKDIAERRENEDPYSSITSAYTSK